MSHFSKLTLLLFLFLGLQACDFDRYKKDLLFKKARATSEKRKYNRFKKPQKKVWRGKRRLLRPHQKYVYIGKPQNLRKVKFANVRKENIQIINNSKQKKFRKGKFKNRRAKLRKMRRQNKRQNFRKSPQHHKYYGPKFEVIPWL